MASPRVRELEELRRAFHELQRQHQALVRAPFDRDAHERHRAHLRAYTEALHRWRAGRTRDEDEGA